MKFLLIEHLGKYSVEFMFMSLVWQARGEKGMWAVV